MLTGDSQSNAKAMGKKRRAESTGLDELERDLYSSFCAAASNMSHLYTSSVTHQKRAFVSGRKKSLVRALGGKRLGSCVELGLFSWFKERE